MFEKQLQILINDNNLFRDFKEKICKHLWPCDECVLLEELKTKRSDEMRRKYQSKSSRLKVSQSVSPTAVEVLPESIIDRNLNLVPHFRDYESEKRKLMFALTNQQTEKAKSYREQQAHIKREKTLLMMNRWHIFRAHAEE